MIGQQLSVRVGHQQMLRLKQDVMQRRAFQNLPHHRLWVLFELALIAGHERAVRYETVERVPDESKFEERLPFRGPHIGANLLQAEMAMLQLGEFWDREMLSDEQADLFEILRPHLLSKCLAHGVRPGLRNRDENEFVERGYNQCWGGTGDTAFHRTSASMTNASPWLLRNM